MRIISIHAHPDDAEMLAGGTLALLAEGGHQITIATMTAGDCGSGEYGSDEISAIRRRESAASAELIGAAYVCAGFRDLSIFSDDLSRRTVVRLLRKLRPDVILTASPDDYLCDHETTSQLVRDACFAAPIPNYFTESGAAPLPRIPHLYYMDPIEMVGRDGKQVTPDFTVNVEHTFPTKQAMLAKHESQRAWLKRQHGIDDYLAKMEQWTRLRGAAAGIALGEGFRQYRTHPFPQTPVLQQELADYIAPSPL